MSDLNPGIRKVVAFLQIAGFDTCDSGDGVTHDFECDRDHAYVVMRVDPASIIEESHRLVALLSEVGVVVTPMTMENTPCIQATYCPANESAFLDLMGVDDALLVSSAADSFVAYCEAHGLAPVVPS